MNCENCEEWKSENSTVGKCDKLIQVNGRVMRKGHTYTFPDEIFTLYNFGCIHFKDKRAFTVSSDGSLWFKNKRGFCVEMMRDVQKLAEWLNEMWDEK